MVTRDPAYRVALQALRDGRYAAMIPGELDGQPAVYTRSVRLTRRGRLAAFHKSDFVRACFAIGACVAARENAERRRMSF